MNYLKRLFALALLLTLAACNKGEMASPENAKFMNVSPAEAEETAQKQKVETDRKIIKTGSIRFQTGDAAGTRALINKVVEEFKGYVSQDNVSDYNQAEHTLTIRVPATKFDALLARVSESAKTIDSKSINAQDVSEEYIDIEARVKTKKELEARYKELLKQANKVEDILAIEKEIGTLRADIESIEGRLRYLTDQVAFSTLTVTFYEKASSAFGFGNKLTDGIKNGWTNILWFIIGVVNVWPFILIAVGLVAALRMYRKRKSDKNTAAR